MEKMERPWGNYTVLEKMKIITLHPHEKLSLQSHEKRDELWRIVNGSGVVTIGNNKYSAFTGQTFSIPKKEIHRVEAGNDGIVFVEVATGEVFEEDIIRYEDVYGRENGSCVVVASGYFDPLHVGHIEYLKLAASLGNKLIVILNNDKQAALKKGRNFMKEDERKVVIEALKYVDKVFLSIDTDRTVCESIRKLSEKEKISIFAKGGDRSAEEIPERMVCDELNIDIVDGLGLKIQSSSFLIKQSMLNK